MSVYSVHLTTDLHNPTDDELDELVEYLAWLSGVPGCVDGRLTLQLSIFAEDIVEATLLAQNALVHASKHLHREPAEPAAIEVQTEEEFLRRLEGPPRVDDLISTSEVAGLLDVSRQRVLALAKRSGFPESVQLGARGRHWSRTQVERFASVWLRRPGPKPKMDAVEDAVDDAGEATPPATVDGTSTDGR